MSSTSKVFVEYKVNNVDVDDGHTCGHAVNLYHGQTDGHAYVRTWSDIVIRGMIGVSNVHIFTA